MLVMTVTDCTSQLRGELTRWLLEIRPHVYVGHVNARVRDQLWQKACDKIKDGSVLQIWNTANEQGFTMRSWNEPTYRVRDFEGVLLVEHPVGDPNVPDGQKSPPRNASPMDGPLTAEPPDIPSRA